MVQGSPELGRKVGRGEDCSHIPARPLLLCDVGQVVHDTITALSMISIPWAWPTFWMRGLGFLTCRTGVGTTPASLAGSHKDECRQTHSTLARGQILGTARLSPAYKESGMTGSGAEPELAGWMGQHWYSDALHCLPTSSHALSDPQSPLLESGCKHPSLAGWS